MVCNTPDHQQNFNIINPHLTGNRSLMNCATSSAATFWLAIDRLDGIELRDAGAMPEVQAAAVGAEAAGFCLSQVGLDIGCSKKHENNKCR